MLSMADAARELGLDYWTFFRGVRVSRCYPEPTHQIGVARRRYYTADEVTHLKELSKQFHKTKGEK